MKVDYERERKADKATDFSGAPGTPPLCSKAIVPSLEPALAIVSSINTRSPMLCSRSKQSIPCAWTHFSPVNIL